MEHTKNESMTARVLAHTGRVRECPPRARTAAGGAREPIIRDSAKQILAKRRRRAREGMTLVEIMIVVIIMALIATAVGVAVLPQLARARITQTRSDALEVRSAVMLYMGQEPGAECPTMDELTEAGVLDHSRRTSDAWDNAFIVECDGDDVAVVSNGPDGQGGTEDDIR